MIVRTELLRHSASGRRNYTIYRQIDRWCHALFLICLSLFAFGTFPMDARAELRQVFKADPAVDVRIVVDISGSMKQSDPQNMRRPAVQLAAEMIPEGAAAGVWTFGRFVNMLVPLRMVDDRWRQQATQSAQKINSVAMYTNIPEALEKAAYGWSDPPGNTARSLILLTDGKVDISKSREENTRARQDVLSRLVPMLRTAKAKVHTIAMSEDVDVELLRALSYETDGRFQTVQSRDDLVRVFVEAFDASVPGQQVPLDPSNRFNIDGGVKEFTLLVHKMANSRETKLEPPSGTAFTASSKPSQVRWFSDARLDVITVTQPEAGSWQLLASVDPGNRVTVISDLRLMLSGLPNNVFEGEAVKLDIHFKDKKGIIKNPDFLRLVDLSFSQNYIDGNKVWNGNLSSFSEGKVNTPGDGRYHPRLEKSLLAGQHEITVLAQGRTFTRKVVQKFNVIDQAVTVNLLPPSEVNAPFTVAVRPVAGLTDAQLRIRAKVQAPNRVVQDLALTLVDAEVPESPRWQGQFEPYGGAGTYRVIVQAIGQTPSGRNIDNKLGPFEADVSAELMGEAPLQSRIELPFDDRLKRGGAPDTVDITAPGADGLDDDVLIDEGPESTGLDDGQDDILDDASDEMLDDQLSDDEVLNDEALSDEALDDELADTLGDVLDDPEAEETLAELDALDDDLYDDADDEEDLTDDELAEEEMSAEDEIDAESSSSVLKWALWGFIALINIMLVVVGMIMYKKAVRRRAEEEAKEDAHLAEMTQADEAELGVTDSSDAGDIEIPDGMPDMPDLDDDDLDDAFDLSQADGE